MEKETLIIILLGLVLIFNILWIRSIIICVLKIIFKRKKKNKNSYIKKTKYDKFRVPKFCRVLWNGVHIQDKKLLRKEPIAMTNFRLGVISSLRALDVDENSIEEVINRIEINKFQ